jgi:hypothetical protein
MPLFPQGGGLYPDSIDNSILADMADGTVKGRALGAGAGNPMDLTPAQMQTLLGMTALLAGFPKLLQTQVAANSAQLDFTAFDNTKYGSYQLRGSGVMPGTDAVGLRLLASTNGGSSFDGTTNYPYVSDTYGIGESTLSVGSTTAAYFAFTGAIKAGAGCYGFTLDIMPGYGTNGSTAFLGHSFGYDSDNKWRRVRNGGAYANAALNAIRLFMSSGVIAQGVFSLYGFPK